MPTQDFMDTPNTDNLVDGNGNIIVLNSDNESCESQCGNNYTASDGCCTAITQLGTACYPKGSNTPVRCKRCGLSRFLRLLQLLALLTPCLNAALGAGAWPPRAACCHFDNVRCT
jgi:hypothetical protein